MQTGRGTLKHMPLNRDHDMVLVDSAEAEPKQVALRYILEAWEEASLEGLDSDCIATAAIFAALSDMIATYGEEPVARMAERLPERIRVGEFTIPYSKQ